MMALFHTPVKHYNGSLIQCNALSQEREIKCRQIRKMTKVSAFSWCHAYINFCKEFTQNDARTSARGQREELHPWQRSWGRRLGIHKGMIKPQETPCSRASNPKTRVCFMLSSTPLTLRGAFPHNRFSWRRSKRAAPRQ